MTGVLEAGALKAVRLFCCSVIILFVCVGAREQVRTQVVRLFGLPLVTAVFHNEWVKLPVPLFRPE